MIKSTLICFFVILRLGLTRCECGQPNVYPNIKTFGPECKLRCNCAYNEKCDNTTGECPNGCLHGWMGPACQYRNLATAAVLTDNELKLTSVEGHYFQGLATDGNISTCSRISPARGHHSMTISLMAQFYIVGMVIRIKRTDFNFFHGFTVDVGNSTTDKFTMCYVHGNENIDAFVDINCVSPLVAQFIRINLDTNVTNDVFLCEMELYGGRLLSFNKPSEMVSTYDDWRSCYAVDGQTHKSDMNQTHTSTRTCAATYPTYINLSDHWWSLDLRRIFSFQSISFYGRQDMKEDNISLIVQSNYFVVETSNDSITFQEVYRDLLPSDDSHDYDPKSHNFTWPLNARFVKLERNNSFILTVCEFEVFGECPVGLCGWECGELCMCKSEIAGKNKILGTCPLGCTGRWTGPGGKCNIECADDRWGPYCNFSCENCLYPCNVENGICPGSCRPGWMTPDCSQVCPEGKYGLNCSYTCGACNVLSKTKCDKETGECFNGCLPGWIGSFCNESCKKGFYGQACFLQCGHCKDGQPCDPQTGHCRLCEAGFTGDSCTAICADGRYGEGCPHGCGHCASEDPCNKTSGLCPNGCSPGFTGHLCKDETQTDKSAGLIAGIVVVSILAPIATGVNLVIFCKRRFARKHSRSIDKNTFVTTTKTDNDTYAVVVGSCKDSKTEGYANLQFGLDSR